MFQISPFFFFCASLFSPSRKTTASTDGECATLRLCGCVCACANVEKCARFQCASQKLPFFLLLLSLFQLQTDCKALCRPQVNRSCFPFFFSSAIVSPDDGKGNSCNESKTTRKKKVRAYFVNLKRHCENDSGLQKSSAVIHVIIYSFIVALLLLLFLQGRKRLKALLFFFVLLFLCQLIWPLKRQSVFYIVSVLFLQFLRSEEHTSELQSLV